MKKQKTANIFKSDTQGITLITLIITIIVMLILAGVTISMVVGDNGVLKQAQEAGKTQSYASAKEKVQMQIEYLYDGVNVGKVDLENTLSNIQNIKSETEEIESADWVDSTKKDSIIVTFTNKETMIIKGNGIDNKNVEPVVSNINDSDKWFYEENQDGTLTITGPRMVKCLQVNDTNVFELMYQDFLTKYPEAKANGDLNSEQIAILDEITSLEEFKNAYIENELYHAPWEVFFTEIVGEGLGIDYDRVVEKNYNNPNLCTWIDAEVASFSFEDDEYGEIILVDNIESYVYRIDLNIPDRINGKTITKIDDEAFYLDNAVVDGIIRLPNGLKEIGDKAFYGMDAKNESLIIPDSVEKIGSRAFRRMDIGVETVVINKDGEEDTERNCELIMSGENLQEIGEDAFEESTFYGDITLKNSVNVGYGAFRDTDINVTYVN